MAERRARVERLLTVARELPAAASLQHRLLETTGLSAQNIARGLAHSLELHPRAEHVDALLASTPEASAAHVLLSGNVFVAALRAIAIGVASSERVKVRASRRDPVLAEALHARAPELFELAPELQPAPGDHVWAYGKGETLAAVRAALPRGVWFHAHGAGFGVALVNARSFSEADARAVALDTALFDQRGCLSPRVVCVVGAAPRGRDVAAALAAALARLEVELPPGPRDAVQLAEQRRRHDAAAYAFELWEAGSGWVTHSEELRVPPADRNLHVVASLDPVTLLRPFAPHLTNLACSDAELAAALRPAFPGARVVPLGEMQRPPLDGPVDLRHGTAGERL